jgi:hypothetical protein
MKISELITLLEQDKERFWDLPIHYIDIIWETMRQWEQEEWKYILE